MGAFYRNTPWNRQPPGTASLARTSITRGMQFLYHPGNTSDLASNLPLNRVLSNQVVEGGLLGASRTAVNDIATVGNTGFAPCDELSAIVVCTPISLFNNDSGCRYLGASEFSSVINQDSFGGGSTLASRLYAVPDFTGSSQVFSSFGVITVGRLHVIQVRYRRNTFHELWVDRNLVASTTPGDYAINIGGVANVSTGQQRSSCIHLAGFWRRALSDAEIRSLAQNPWQLLSPLVRKLPSISISSYNPSSDVSTSGWTTTEATYYGAVNETVFNDTTYISSPPIIGSSTYSIIMGLSGTLAPGSYDVTIRFASNGGTKLRTLLLDNSNTVLGTSTWRNATSSYASYTLPVSITGTATRIQIDVANI